MSYLTPQQLADGPESLREYAELYGIEPALLAATLAGGDRSPWSADDVAAADAALASIGRFIVQAGGEMDARLAVRGYALPVDASRFPVLVVWARAIARYHIHRQRDMESESSGRQERDYRDALRALDLIAEGKLGLGADDPLLPAPGNPADPHAGPVRVQGRERLFSRDTLGGL